MIYMAYGCDPNNAPERTSIIRSALRNHEFTSLFIEPASACNLRCRFCDFHMNSAQDVFRKQKGIMSMETFHMTMRNLLALPFKFKVAYFNLHGEPLLNPSVAEMVRLAKEKDLVERYSISTNGVLLTDAMLQDLIEAGINTIIVSLDTARMKKYREFKGSDRLDLVLDHIFNAIEVISASRSRISLHIKCTLQSGCYGISEEDTESVLLLFKKHAEHSEKINIYFLREFNWYTRNKQEQLTVDHRLCDLPFFQVAIHYDGTVSACCIDINFDLAIGRITASETSLREMLEGKKLRTIRKTHLSGNLENLPACMYCENRPVTELNQYREEALQLI